MLLCLKKLNINSLAMGITGYLLHMEIDSPSLQKTSTSLSLPFFLQKEPQHRYKCLYVPALKTMHLLLQLKNDKMPDKFYIPLF